ncbi:MAG: LytR C-terminal domain-containing protein [Nocardioidaceae bacterium]|nr:LytR C-terminal domain-containing protein [Nocardioidaceae bacterium]
MTLKTPITLLFLVLMLMVASVYGWRLLSEDAPPLSDLTAPEPTCRTKQISSGSQLRSNQVTVNVYNAGSISGLADSTMRSLTRRGFLSGLVENAPAKTRTNNVLVLDPQPKSASVRLVTTQFDGRVEVRRNSDDLADGVDVFVGDDFQGFDANAKTSVAVRNRTNVCVPIDPTS